MASIFRRLTTQLRLQTSCALWAPGMWFFLSTLQNATRRIAPASLFKIHSTQQRFQVPGLRTQDSPPGKEAGKRGRGLGRRPGSAEKVPTAGGRASMPSEHWSLLNGSPSFWGSHLQSQASRFQPGAGERWAASRWHASATSQFLRFEIVGFPMSLNLWPMPPPSSLLSTVFSVSDIVTINAVFTNWAVWKCDAQEVGAGDSNQGVVRGITWYIAEWATPSALVSFSEQVGFFFFFLSGFSK